jgi:hypothetical protein
MKSIGIVAAILATTIALAGCKNRKEEPIPGPKASHPAAESVQAPSAPSPSSRSPDRSAGRGGDAPRHGASGISWFQGTVEEAFSTTCGNCTAMFWHEALDQALDR